MLVSKIQCNQNCNYITSVQNPISFNCRFLTDSFVRAIPELKITNLEKNKDLKIIHKIEKEAFSDLTIVPDIFRIFKMFYKFRGDGTRLIKDSKNNLIGYYQYQFLKDENAGLYIDALAVQQKYRKTQIAAMARKEMFKDIQKIARENGCDVVTLTMNKENQNLLEMYEKHGFKVVSETILFYKNGNSAYFMRADVDDIKF